MLKTCEICPRGHFLPRLSTVCATGEMAEDGTNADLTGTISDMGVCPFSPPSSLGSHLVLQNIAKSIHVDAIAFKSINLIRHWLVVYGTKVCTVHAFS